MTRPSDLRAIFAAWNADQARARAAHRLNLARDAREMAPEPRRRRK